MDYMEDTDWMEQVQDAVGGLLARPPLKRAKPEEDGEDRSDEAPEGKGQGQGKRQKQEPGLPPTADTTTGGAPTDRGPAHLFDAEARVTIAGAGQHRPISALFCQPVQLP